jgi:hypothetical protein
VDYVDAPAHNDSLTSAHASLPPTWPGRAPLQLCSLTYYKNLIYYICIYCPEGHYVCGLFHFDKSIFTVPVPLPLMLCRRGQLGRCLLKSCILHTEQVHGTRILWSSQIIRPTAHAFYLKSTRNIGSSAESLKSKIAKLEAKLDCRAEARSLSL